MISTVKISNNDEDVELYKMTLLAFNIIQRCAVEKVDGWELQSFWKETNRAYTCYTNGIIDFSCQSDKVNDYHLLIKEPTEMEE